MWDASLILEKNLYFIVVGIQEMLTGIYPLFYSFSSVLFVRGTTHNLMDLQKTPYPKLLHILHVSLSSDHLKRGSLSLSNIVFDTTKMNSNTHCFRGIWYILLFPIFLVFLYILCFHLVLFTQYNIRR